MIHPSLRNLAIPIASVFHDPTNARKHPERNLEVIKASLADFGQRKPIIVRREGMVVEAGNGTLAAARDLGWSEIAAVIVDDDALTATRFGIVDNRSAELAEWDDENLGELLGALSANDVDMGAMGFNDEELHAIHGKPMEEENAAPGDLNPIIRYEIIFDTVEHQDRFYRWLKLLKEEKPLLETVSARINDALHEMDL